MRGRVTLLLALILCFYATNAMPFRTIEGDHIFGKCGGITDESGRIKRDVPTEFDSNESTSPSISFLTPEDSNGSHSPILKNQTLGFRIKMWPTHNLVSHLNKSEAHKKQYEEVVINVVRYFSDLFGVDQHEVHGNLTISGCLDGDDFLNETNDLTILNLQDFDYHLVITVGSNEKKCKGEVGGDATRTVALAGAGCGQIKYHSTRNKRPIIGNCYICEPTINGDPMQNMAIESTIKHELFHALGFSNLADPNGSWKNHVKTEIVDWKSIYSSSKRKRTVITHPEVVTAAREHFGCETLNGIEIENSGGKGTQGSHWEMRIFGPEIMVGMVSRRSYVSNITLSLMATLGDKIGEERWYKFVNFSKADKLWYGNKAGCRFTSGSCMDFIEAELNSDHMPRTPSFPFCSKRNVEAFLDVSLIGSTDLGTCSPDKKQVLKCRLAQPVEKVDDSEKWTYYYEGSKELKRVRGSLAIMEYCPVFMDNVHSDKDSNCFNHYSQPKSENNSGAEVFGANSLCFEQKTPFFTSDCTKSQFKRLLTGDGKTFRGFAGGGCYQFLCVRGRLLVSAAGDSVRYGPKVCWAEGSRVIIRRNVDKAFTYGELICPKCEHVCNAANGHSDFVCLPPILGMNPRDQLEPACTKTSDHLNPKTTLILAFIIMFCLIM